MSEFWFFTKEGLFHVLDWQAYDHVLFFIALVVCYTYFDWRKVLLLVTLFTLGHMTSLFLESYVVVSSNARIIEFLIPVTILLTAVFNMVDSRKSVNKSKSYILYGTTVFFGLIHGFGFSRYFKMISSTSANKFLSLLEFSLGIEIAQIIVVAIILLLGFVVQTFLGSSKRDWRLVVSAIVIGMVIPMIIENKIW